MQWELLMFNITRKKGKKSTFVMQWEQVKKQVKKKRMLASKEKEHVPTVGAFSFSVQAFSFSLFASLQVKKQGGK